MYLCGALYLEPFQNRDKTTYKLIEFKINTTSKKLSKTFK